MDGYSTTSLVKKLGIKEGMTVAFRNEPRGYDSLLGKMPNGITTNTKELDFIQYFTKEKKALEEEFTKLKQSLSYNGMLWISWPKKSSNMITDLNENIIRNIGLRNGLVDTKVVAVDETWSGLKFVYRLTDRK